MTVTMKPSASTTLNDGARHHPHTLSTLVSSAFPCIHIARKMLLMPLLYKIGFSGCKLCRCCQNHEGGSCQFSKFDQGWRRAQGVFNAYIKLSGTKTLLIMLAHLDFQPRNGRVLHAFHSLLEWEIERHQNVRLIESYFCYSVLIYHDVYIVIGKKFNRHLQNKSYLTLIYLWKHPPQISLN